MDLLFYHHPEYKTTANGKCVLATDIFSYVCYKEQTDIQKKEQAKFLKGMDKDNKELVLSMQGFEFQTAAPQLTIAKDEQGNYFLMNQKRDIFQLGLFDFYDKLGLIQPNKIAAKIEYFIELCETTPFEKAIWKPLPESKNNISKPIQTTIFK